MKVHNEPIPENRMRQFHEILCETGGRYTINPIYQECENAYRVSYIPGDYIRQSELYQQITTPIRETKKDQWWRIAARRIKRWMI